MKLIASKYYTLLFCVIWIYLLSSLNSPPFHSLGFTFNQIITFLRGIAPLLVLLFVICYLLFSKFNKKNNFSLIDSLIIIYFISQIFSYIYMNGWVFSKDIYWPLSGLSLLFFLNIAKNYDRKNLIYFLNISVFLIAMLSSYLIYKIFDEFYLNFFNENYFFNSSWYSANAIAEHTELFGKEIPRSSGLARMLFLVFIYLLISFLYKENFIYKKKIYLITGLLIFLFSFCIWHVQNRLVIIYYLILIIFFVLPFDNIKFTKKIQLLLLFSIIPFILHTLEPIFRKNLLESLNPNLNIKNNIFLKKKEISKIDLKNYDFGFKSYLEFESGNTLAMPQDSKLVLIDRSYIIKLKNDDLLSLVEITNEATPIIKNLITDYSASGLDMIEILALSNRIIMPFVNVDRMGRKLENVNKPLNLLSNTSGRVRLWKKTLPYISSSYFGYGPQADRIYIKQNISNLILYSLLCGGIIGAISIISIYLLIIYKIINLVFMNQIFKKKNYLYEKISIIIIGFLLLRSLVEVSFGIFSIDMIFFLVTLKIIYHSPIYNKKTS
ncbi:hypothetical protein OAB65_00395 [bacterium]|nr:hypothetical protein [bacterium]